MASIRAEVAAVVSDDPEQAAHDAAEQMLEALGTDPDLVLVFASGDFAPDRVMVGLDSRLPERAKVVGCSADAEIDSRGALRRSVSVMGFSLDGIEARTFHVHEGENEARGRAAAEQLGSGDPSVVVAMCDVLEANGTRFLLGLQEVLGRGAPIVGGAPACSGHAQRTFTLHGREGTYGGAAGFALYGPVELTSAAKSGYMPLGVARTVTRVDGRAILELDGLPALDLYLEYIGDRWSDNRNTTTEFPIGVVGGALGTQKQADEGVKLVRAIFRLEKERKALILGGDMPEGAVIRVLRAGREDVLQGAEEATDLAATAMQGKPDVALVFSCISRRAVLGPRYRDECRVAFSQLPAGVPKAGFYTFGEISPLSGVSMHHESTFTIALLRAGH